MPANTSSRAARTNQDPDNKNYDTMLTPDNRDAVAAGVSLHWLKAGTKEPRSYKLKDKDGVVSTTSWNAQPVYSIQVLERLYNRVKSPDNIGFRPGYRSKTDAGYLHVIDLDINDETLANQAHAALAELAPGYEQLPTVISGSGGSSRHFYFTHPVPLSKKVVAKSDSYTWVFDKKKNKQVKKHDWQIEILGNCNCVLPPSIHPNTGKPYKWVKPLEWEMLELGVGYPIKINTEVKQYSADVVSIDSTERWGGPWETVLDALKHYPNDDLVWEDWDTVCKALMHETGNSELGFKIFVDWSKQSEKYDAKETRELWQSYAPKPYRKKHPNPTRIYSLFLLAQGKGWDRPDDTYSTWIDLASVFEDLPDDMPDDCDGLLDTVKPKDKTKLKGKNFRRVKGMLELTEKKHVVKSDSNIVTILRNDERVKGMFRFNEFSNGFEVARELKLVGQQHPAGPLQDAHLFAVKLWMDKPENKGGWGFAMGKTRASEMIQFVARDPENKYHPIKDMLESVKHDGKQRVERLFIDYFGCPEDAYHREAARLFLIAAVARVYEPGHKFDFMPVLEGKQGLGKSTFVKTLAMDEEYFTDEDIDWSDTKKVMEVASGKWIIEVGEMASLAKQEVKAMKRAGSANKDKSRMAYAQFAEERPRQFVRIGTTNDKEYLKDPTGDRRYWPIETRVDVINLKKLKRELPQIWAEALTMYRAMRVEQPHGDLPLCLNGEALETATELQGSRQLETPEAVLAGKIEWWADQPLGSDYNKTDGEKPQYRQVLCVQMIWEEMINEGRPRDEIPLMSNNQSYTIARAMTLLKDKWPREKRKTIPKYGSVFNYRRVG